MPYTYKSLVFVWLVTLVLFVLTGSGVVTGRWLLLLLVVALAVPALILRRPRPVADNDITRTREAHLRPARIGAPSDISGRESYRSESDGD